MCGAFKDKDFLGSFDEVDLQQVFLDFLATAREIRSALGNKGYLLDEYVNNLLDGFRETRDGVGETLSVGYEAGMVLNGICSDILRREYKKEQDEFYLAAKAYIEAHPIKLECHMTKRALFSSLLSGPFHKESAEDHCQEALYACGAVYDGLSVNDLFERICAIMGDEALMERLNDLFRQRFLRASAKGMFLQGEALGLAQALTFRDIETNKRVVHLLIDGILPPTEE